MPLLSAFKQRCLETPEAIALIEGQQQLSYQQLMQRIYQLSSCLAAVKIPRPRVVIALDRGIDATIAVFAVLGVDACYIPLDMKNPPHRLNYIINDAAPGCIIGKGACPDWLESPELWLDIGQADFAPSGSQILATANPESIAAILYTSGSTGTPKGVALSHRALANFANWAASTFTLSPLERIASLAPFHFDLSIFDLFSCLSCGATVNFMPASLTLSPSRLTAWLQEQRISVFYTVPSLLGFIALKGALKTTPLPDLKTVLFAGEVFPTPQLITLCELLPTVQFYNLYGPTETNVCCYWPIDRERLQPEQAIPIGYPACGALLEIDEKTGELRVQSANNLSGYWQQGKLGSALSADDFYNTGDKVSLNGQGEYCYHGRLDRMLKCSGYRVEPSEIEAVLLSCPEVANCAVIGIPDSTSGQRPAAVVVLKPGAKLETIVKPIKQGLPAYMQPSKIIALDALPYLSNGKTDYQALLYLLEKN
ncbi:MAG: amino acid adenylation domain-containing protein [Methylococcales bacterium]|nr:amino acid adenylation domain-containing protein [Methylococcales bacterium]